jgi:hypothetical protein
VIFTVLLYCGAKGDLQGKVVVCMASLLKLLDLLCTPLFVEKTANATHNKNVRQQAIKSIKAYKTSQY